MEIIGNGRTAEVMGYDESCVLKLFRPFMDGNSVEREYGIATYAHQKGLPTPKPVARITQNDRQGIVYQRINGKSLLGLLSDKPMQMTKIARQMAKLHCQINAVELTDAQNDQKANIRYAINAASDLCESDKQKIIAYLNSLPGGNRLCHGDFHPDNIIADDALWIIDWMTGSSGNPLGDIARSKLILETSEIPDSVPPGMRYLLRIGSNKLAKSYVKEYCKISKVKIKDIDAWLLPLYAARLVENLSDKEKDIILRKIRKEMRKRLPDAK